MQGEKDRFIASVVCGWVYHSSTSLSPAGGFFSLFLNAIQLLHGYKSEKYGKPRYVQQISYPLTNSSIIRQQSALPATRKSCWRNLLFDKALRWQIPVLKTEAFLSLSGITLVLIHVDECYESRCSSISLTWSVWPKIDFTIILHFSFCFWPIEPFSCKSTGGGNRTTNFWKR